MKTRMRDERGLLNLTTYSITMILAREAYRVTSAGQGSGQRKY